MKTISISILSSHLSHVLHLSSSFSATLSAEGENETFFQWFMTMLKQFFYVVKSDVLAITFLLFCLLIEDSRAIGSTSESFKKVPSVQPQRDGNVKLSIFFHS